MTNLNATYIADDYKRYGEKTPNIIAGAERLAIWVTSGGSVDDPIYDFFDNLDYTNFEAMTKKDRDSLKILLVYHISGEEDSFLSFDDGDFIIRAPAGKKLEALADKVISAYIDIWKFKHMWDNR
jgi:hypothetical protein